jgi:hypothetical protein
LKAILTAIFDSLGIGDVTKARIDIGSEGDGLVQRGKADHGGKRGARLWLIAAAVAIAAAGCGNNGTAGIALPRGPTATPIPTSTLPPGFESGALQYRPTPTATPDPSAAADAVEGKKSFALQPFRARRRGEVASREGTGLS